MLRVVRVVRLSELGCVRWVQYGGDCVPSDPVELLLCFCGPSNNNGLACGKSRPLNSFVERNC